MIFCVCAVLKIMGHMLLKSQHCFASQLSPPFIKVHFFPFSTCQKRGITPEEEEKSLDFTDKLALFIKCVTAVRVSD